MKPIDNAPRAAATNPLYVASSPTPAAAAGAPLAAAPARAVAPAGDAYGGVKPKSTLMDRARDTGREVIDSLKAIAARPAGEYQRELIRNLRV